MVHTFNVREAEAVRSVWVWGRPDLHSELSDNQGCIVRLYPNIQKALAYSGYLLLTFKIMFSKCIFLTCTNEKKVGNEHCSSLLQWMITPARILDYFLTPPSVSRLHPESLTNFFRFYIHIGYVATCIFLVTVCMSSLRLSSLIFDQMTISKVFLPLVLKSVTTHYNRLHAAASEIFLNCWSNQMYPLLQAIASFHSGIWYSQVSLLTRNS